MFSAKEYGILVNVLRLEKGYKAKKYFEEFSQQKLDSVVFA